jgi:hypothetical protein
MVPNRLVLLSSLAGLAFPGGALDDLAVLRHVPGADAAPTAVILVTFDRPVAEDLDRTLPAARVFSIEPAVAGTADWRDPITLRFTPSAPLPIGTRYTVTIADDFTAADGSRLTEPYRFTFRVRGPAVLSSSLEALGEATGYLDIRPRLQLVVSGPGDFAQLARASYLELAPPCGRDRTVRLTLAGDRAVNDQDPWQFRRWTWGDDEVGLRGETARVVDLTPERELPRDCPGVLVVPRHVDPETAGEPHRWSFRTYGPLRLVEARCGGDRWCATGPLRLRFSTPVRGTALAAALRLSPAAAPLWTDTAAERTTWWVPADLTPRTAYTVTIDSTLRDAFGQSLGRVARQSVTTTGYPPSVEYPVGRLLVERLVYRTLTVSHMNVDTLLVAITPIPDSLLPALLARPWGHDELIAGLAGTRVDTVAVPRLVDRSALTAVRLPVFNAQRPGSPAFIAVQVDTSAVTVRRAPVALVQVTDLAVHARLGLRDGAVWVVGAGDGLPRAGAEVVLYDGGGHERLRARTDAQGLVRFPVMPPVPADTAEDDEDWFRRAMDGYVSVVLGNDRAIVPVSDNDWELNPWRFSVRAAWDAERAPLAAAVFTERGIYRPGETVHAKLVVRRGLLGALASPPAGDSARVLFADREGAAVRDTVVRLSAFGTAEQSFTVADGAPLGSYQVRVASVVNGEWIWVGTAGYRIAEYRPPEFLADVRPADTVRVAGDTLGAAIEGRYLFGAPMAGAVVQWAASRATVAPWALRIPGTDGWSLTEARWWWEETSSFPQVFLQGSDSLDAQGGMRLAVPLPESPGGQPYRAAVTATIVDVNRQTSSATAGATVHPAAFYLGVRAVGQEYFWRANEPREVEVIAVRPTGARVAGVAVRGVLVRREWHRVRRERDGYSQIVGEWVSDTVGTCTLTTVADAPARCRLTPGEGGQYTLRFTAADPAGRNVAAGLYRWVTGADWVPWYDDTQLKMDVVADRDRYGVGDTALVLFASPFTDAEAWVTVEREGIIEQRRVRITSGTTTLAFPITEAWAPNAFVSIVVSRGRTAPPGRFDDPGRPAMRVGYAEIRVTPEVKRLKVGVTPLADEYRPGDTARLRLHVADAAGRGARSEVTLWAVDEGVLALTGYETPDPIGLLYAPRGVGVRLGSNLAAVAAQVLEKGSTALEKGRAPGGGGGFDADGILRSRFASTAFFLGSVVTDTAGRAEAAARLPDNLTTFRVMAVAVTAGDRYGSGESPMLVTRPLIARPALPRFVREGDTFEAGVVVNHRLGQAAEVAVEAQARGITLTGGRRIRARLESGRGREVRFPFTGLAGDSAVFQFKVSSGAEADAVETRLAIRPAFHVRTHTVAGTLRDQDTVTLTLPADIDPARSRLDVRLGTSPLTVIRAMQAWLRVYPYDCSEQVTSAALPLIALLDAARTLGDSTIAPRSARADLEQAVRVLTRRQGADGGIGFWRADDWTSPWLTAHAGLALLGARDIGLSVSDSVIAGIRDYLVRALRRPQLPHPWLDRWFRRERIALGEQLAALDFLTRAGAFDAAAANRLVERAGHLTLADRARLADVLARGGMDAEARRLMEAIWGAIRVEGRRAVLPADTSAGFYFRSAAREPAAVLAATVAMQPDHPLVSPLVETLLGAARAEGWNTQDIGAAVPALARLERAQRAAGDRDVRVRVGSRTLTLPADSSVALSGLLAGRGEEPRRLTVQIEARRDGPPVFYDVSVREVPSRQPVRPDDGGITLERWYETLTDGKPTIRVAPGDLVRVRLRVTVPADRQFVVLDDALPAGLEAVDVSLRTQGELPGVEADQAGVEGRRGYGMWYGSWWSPFDHREIRDDRVVFAATLLPAGTYWATYVARATTPGTFVRPPAHAEEMYNPAVRGRSEGGTFTVGER